MAFNRAGSSASRGYGWRWQQRRLLILERDHHVCRCATCTALGRVRPATEVDHVVPKYAGGTDDPSNLQAINADCHAAKTQAEARAARGLEDRIGKACGIDGIPINPRHHWR